MNEKQIKQLSADGFFEHKPILGTLEETHISWVILSEKFVFKIKKPVKLSFLDFSTLLKREQLCEKELVLNSRFSSIYVAVVPVINTNGQWTIGDGTGTVIDYAVQMKRLNPDKRMDKLLSKGLLSKSLIISLAKEVAQFHLNAELIKTPFIASEATTTFNDILSISQFVGDNLGAKFLNIIERSVKCSGKILAKYALRLSDRIVLGFKRDVHGDLHSGNIFAYKRPIIFDCIEFNDSYRQIDVLSEIAFLCMDLEAFNRKDLAEIFFNEYKSLFDCCPLSDDYLLFNYYKCLRANIRAKVHAIHGGQAESHEAFDYHLNRLETYLTLLKRYTDIL